MSDIDKAKELLLAGGYTCVLCRGGKVETSSERGVRPLLRLIDEGRSLEGFSAADRVVGNGAAFLYAVLKPDFIYAGVISRAARSTLEKYGIPFEYGVAADGIVNRSGTGPCPMEEAVEGSRTPEEALAAVRAKLASIN